MCSSDLDALIKQVKTIKVGPTSDKATEMGPLISAAQRTRVDGFVQRASKKAEVVLGGKSLSGKGYYYRPTIVAGPAQASEIVQDEVFGPVGGEVGQHAEVVADAGDGARDGLSRGAGRVGLGVERRPRRPRDARRPDANRRTAQIGRAHV